jgi:flagellar basal-body rod protein FlgB
MQASNVSELLFNNLSFSAQKQKVISSNIANINTPNYKTKELVFEDELKLSQSKSDLKLKVTHDNHIGIQQEINSNKSKPKIVEVKNLEEQNDGNNVSLDQQITDMSKNKTLATAMQMAIKKDSRWFKSVIESSSKN